MADADARREAIRQASHRVRTGNAFVRRASESQSIPAPTRTSGETVSARSSIARAVPRRSDA